MRQHKIIRFILTLLLWAILVGAPNYLSIVADRRIDLESMVLSDSIHLAIFLSPMLPLALVARMVSYRARDCLFYLIPFYGVYVFSITILWRFAYLPARDWPQRPNENRI
ncbi:hypothetical protein Psi02_27090 [Planotetraspora silvatica]|uniref:Uncharacterized protein n=1 Tax=Planotetraspora silvatica TaxID=234614 RepID=A0A8J3UKR7_9ACTN|nr:hypothetical protein Psi02_27090 [Planotetraspora silvatica]